MTCLFCMQEAALHVGRVVCEGEGRLSAGGALLEGTLAHSQGAHIRLDLSGLPAFRVFPGQARPPALLPFSNALCMSSRTCANFALATHAASIYQLLAVPVHASEASTAQALRMMGACRCWACAG